MGLLVMKVRWRFVVVVVFLAGFLLTGMIGTSTSMTFIWPAYAFLGLAGILSIGLLFKETTFLLPRWCTLTILSLTAYLLIRASESTVAYFAREDAALIVVAFLSYCLFLSLFSSFGWRRKWLFTLAVLVALNLVFAAIQSTFKPTLWLIPGYERTFADSPGGLFNHPDHFAGFIGALVPLWLGMALFGTEKRNVRRLWAILAISSIVATIFSGSASGILALTCGLLALAVLTVFIMYRRISPRAKRVFAILLSGISVVLFVITFSVLGPIGRSIDHAFLTKKEGTSLPLIWNSGLKQASQAPLLGTGSRTSYVYSRLFRVDDPGNSSAESEFIHNEYLQIAADYGLVALALILVTLALHGYSGFRFAKSYAGTCTSSGHPLPKSDQFALVLGSMGSLAAIGVLSVFDFTMHLPVFVIVAAVFLAVLAAPDPMATILKASTSPQIIPGGSLMFVNRALVFGCGIAMLFSGFVFSRSEYHYEMARIAFEADPAGFNHFRHLKEARGLDSKNPFILTLSAHAQVAGITSNMAAPERKQALEQSDHYFNQARALYPQDIFAAIGHAAVLDELQKREHALQRLRDAREMAPGYGNLMLAEAEHHLRYGKIAEAEDAFREAMGAGAFRDIAAAQEGLRTITEWQLIAEENGIDWRDDTTHGESDRMNVKPDGFRRMPAARIAERALAAEAVPAPPAVPHPASEEKIHTGNAAKSDD
ncbi:MAG: O-antigen ligase family protein [Verrucomicrobiales bacterium]|nr:O-antigen ligase family protein [Verrucomicrobiales bacterium]